MDIIRITKTGSELYTKAMELYKISFPEHEQRLPASQAEIIGNNAYHLTQSAITVSLWARYCTGISAGRTISSIFAFCRKSETCTTDSGYLMHILTCR